jgi:hypothetical protein
MQRFELKNSFGWTFFVLIVASFWSAAVKFDASPSSAPAVASRSTVENSSSTFDAVERMFSPENAPLADLLAEPGTTFFKAALPGVSRRVQDSTRRRLGGDDCSSFAGSTKSPSVASGLSSAIFRSFWDCQSASRPLFLTLRSLRN